MDRFDWSGSGLVGGIEYREDWEKGEIVATEIPSMVQKRWKGGGLVCWSSGYRVRTDTRTYKKMDIQGPAIHFTWQNIPAIAYLTNDRLYNDNRGSIVIESWPGKLLTRLPLGKGGAIALAWLSGSYRLLSLREGGKQADLWCLQTKKVVETLSFKVEVTCIASYKGGFLAGVANGSLAQHDGDGKCLGGLDTEEGALTYLSTEQKVITAHRNGTIAIWGDKNVTKFYGLKAHVCYCGIANNTLVVHYGEGGFKGRRGIFPLSNDRK